MHVNEFAAQLRELKDRSGRSYGMLAKRLHVSTSTLHRYCNGAAVPGDYAPVERFARVCGATPEELVELHRRWLLADAERRHEPARASKDPADEGPTVESPAVEPPPAPSVEPESFESEPESVAEPTERDQPVVAAAAFPEPLQPRRPRRMRRARVLLAALAVVAVAVPVALTTAQGSGDTTASVTSPSRSTASHPAVTVPATPRTSGSLSSSPSALTPSQSGSSSSLTSPSASGPADGSGDSTAAPFQVSVMSDNWDTQCDQWFLMSQAPSEVKPPPAIEATGRWASALGAVPAAHLRLQLTAQGGSSQSVVLHALYVHVVSSRPAPKGYGYTAGSGCGGGLTPASFVVELDSPDPHARAVPGYEGNNPTPVMDFPFQTSASDPQVLDVDAHTADQDVSWYLDLLWSSGDRQGVLRVDDHGQPFRTVGLAGDPTYFYNGSTWTPTAPPS
ncbi:plasmid maintenance system antidote protein VapI [Streptacidiphilus sp. BW17]|uniref:helix-turn-helix domain-containing protein n=1 Tax=Streptacidiphilus sp. BW17 TaxID=3156274 RepID=UPI00351243C1